MDFISLKTVHTPQELESLGPFEEIRNTVEREIAPLRVDAASWEKLYTIVVKLQGHWDSLQRDAYFKNENARYIYALVYMDGEERNKIIGLDPSLYDDMEKARRWYLFLSKKVHPDHNPKNPADAEKAFHELDRIYKRLQWAAKDPQKTEDSEDQ